MRYLIAFLALVVLAGGFSMPAKAGGAKCISVAFYDPSVCDPSFCILDDIHVHQAKWSEINKLKFPHLKIIKILIEFNNPTGDLTVRGFGISGWSEYSIVYLPSHGSDLREGVTVGVYFAPPTGPASAKRFIIREGLNVGDEAFFLDETIAQHSMLRSVLHPDEGGGNGIDTTMLAEDALHLSTLAGQKFDILGDCNTP